MWDYVKEGDIFQDNWRVFEVEKSLKSLQALSRDVWERSSQVHCQIQREIWNHQTKPRRQKWKILSLWKLFGTYLSYFPKGPWIPQWLLSWAIKPILDNSPSWNQVSYCLESYNDEEQRSTLMWCFNHKSLPAFEPQR